MSYPSIQVTFLGTGTSSGIPMIACSCEVCTSADRRDVRLRSSILVRSDSTTVVVDAGPDFRYQMLRAGVKELDGIIFTHPHKDHVAGLDDVRAYNFFSGMPMDVYANEMTEEVLIREFPYAFTEKRYPGVPEIRLNTIDQEVFTVGDLDIQPIQVWHLRMPVLGFRFGDFTYITDANRIDKEEMDKIRGTRVLVLNALRREKHISHFNLDDALEIIEQLDTPETYLTHLSHQMGTHEEVQNQLPPHVHLAYDGLSFSV